MSVLKYVEIISNSRYYNDINKIIKFLNTKKNIDELDKNYLINILKNLKITGELDLFKNNTKNECN